MSFMEHTVWASYELPNKKAPTPKRCLGFKFLPVY